MQTTRRSFLQSMAAAMSVAVVGVHRSAAEPSPPVIDYSLFTDRETTRYDLSAPWSKDGAIYATNSRILVTHPGEWNGDGTGRVPNVGVLPWGEFDARGWSPLGKTKRVEADGCGYCFVCRGVGVLGSNLTECGECFGTGEDYPENYEWTGCSRPCSKCVLGYLGGVKCAACENGRVDYVEELGGYEYDPLWIAAIRTLGPVDVHAIEDTDKYGRVCGMLLFRGAGGVRGMLMGMTRSA